MNALGFRSAVLFSIGLWAACATDEGGSAAGGDGAGEPPDATAAGTGGGAGETTAPDGGTASSGGGGGSSASGAGSGGEGGSGGASPLRDDECVPSEDNPGWCSATRQVSGWECCTIRGARYDQEQRCTMGTSEILSCFVAKYCEVLPTESCLMGDSEVFHTTNMWDGNEAARAAGLGPCPEPLRSEVLAAPSCEDAGN